MINELLTLDSAAHSGDATVHAVSAPCRHTSEGVFVITKILNQYTAEELSRNLGSHDEFCGITRVWCPYTGRRTGTSTSCGVGLKDICKHNLENMDGLNEISLTKVYYQLKPANSRSINAARHKDALDIRLGIKSCDVTKEYPNAHEYFTTVANICQLGALYPDQCVSFSCDSKAEIHWRSSCVMVSSAMYILPQ